MPTPHKPPPQGSHCCKYPDQNDYQVAHMVTPLMRGNGLIHIQFSKKRANIPHSGLAFIQLAIGMFASRVFTLVDLISARKAFTSTLPASWASWKIPIATDPER